MAEVKVNEVPIMTSSEWTDNDNILCLDDGKLKQLQRPTFQAWMLANVQGEKGEQGVAGRDGTNGINGSNGTNGISATHSWSGTTLTVTSASGTSSANLKGETGNNGVNGNNGWNMLLVVSNRGNDRVLQVVDWVGGTGTKPTTLGYIGTGGIVSNISNAVNIRGDVGEKGDTGDTGATGATGNDGLGVSAIAYNIDNSIKVTLTDSSVISSSAPTKLTGWGSYKDGVYTTASPFAISPTTEVVIPNNGATVRSSLPTNVTSFYNTTSQKMLLGDINGAYTVRVRFKVAPLLTPTIITLSMSKDTTDIPFSQDIRLRDDSVAQDVDITTTIYGDASIVSNGVSAKLKTYTNGVSISGIEFIVYKLM